MENNRNCFSLLDKQGGKKRYVCVGLDPDIEKIPDSLKKSGKKDDAVVAHFLQEIIGATHEVACAYKLNLAFFEVLGIPGMYALKQILKFVRVMAPEIPIILDGKRGDIGNTSEKYAEALFDVLGADAVTVNPYLGQDAIQPFLDYTEKGIFMLCKTSNPGSAEFQDALLLLDRKGLNAVEKQLGREISEGTVPLYLFVAYRIVAEWNKNNNCGLVVGATHPRTLTLVREMAPNMPFLIPGIGKQGGDIEATLRAGLGKNGVGIVVINSSRGIIHASSGDDYAIAAGEAAMKLNSEIIEIREKIMRERKGGNQ